MDTGNTTKARLIYAGHGLVDKNGNPPTSGMLQGDFRPCPLCNVRRKEQP